MEMRQRSGSHYRQTPGERGRKQSGELHFGVEGNNVNRHARLLDNSILAYSPDGEQIVIALYETGDDAKARTVFFTYDGEKLQETGSLQADIRRASTGSWMRHRRESGYFWKNKICH